MGVGREEIAGEEAAGTSATVGLEAWLGAADSGERLGAGTEVEHAGGTLTDDGTGIGLVAGTDENVGQVVSTGTWAEHEAGGGNGGWTMAEAGAAVAGF